MHNPLDDIPLKLQELNKKTDTVNQLAACINTANDSHQVRETLRTTRQECVQLATECERIIRSSPSTPQQAQLSKELNNSMERFKKAGFNALSKEKNNPLHAHQAPMTGDLRGFVSQAVQTQIQIEDITIQECTELDIDNEIIRDKNESLETIKKGLEYNKEIRQDLGYLIESQSDALEETLLLSHKNKKISESGLKLIAEASKKKNATRIKYCVILGIILGGLLMCALIIAAWVGLHAAIAA